MTLCSDSAIARICANDQRTALFIHQAALAGCILKKLTTTDMKDLPWTYNYAISLADRMPSNKKARSLDDLVTFRYEGAFSDLPTAA